MAQAFVESIFDVFYLFGVISAGTILFIKGKENQLVKKFGLMAILLGTGDAFHLVPRMVALWTTGLEAHAAALGIGKFITSITMTVFYLILYYIWRERYNIQGRKLLTTAFWVLTATRIAISLFPQNEWLNYNQPLLWGVMRNIPFALMGILIIVLFTREAKKADDQIFRYRNQLATAGMSGLYTIRTKIMTRGKTPAILIHQRRFKRRINSAGSC